MIRVDYEIKSYHFAINFILNNYIKHSQDSRKYVDNNNTLKHRRNSFANVYNQVLKGKS